MKNINKVYKKTILLAYILLQMTQQAFSWGEAHSRITEFAISCLPKWQQDFIGDEAEPLSLEYCLYPDHYYGDRKTTINPYIMPELRTYTMPMHLASNDEIDTKIFIFYVSKSLELLSNPESRVEGLRFTGTFLHMLQDRGCPAHCIPVDNFWEGLAQFIPSSKGKAIWVHSAMENLNKEYSSGLPDYKPVLIGKDAESIVGELKRRMNLIHQIVAPLIIPLSEAIYTENKTRAFELQIVAAQELTILCADFLYSVIAVAHNRFNSNKLNITHNSPETPCMQVEYSEDKIIPFYRQKFSWEKGYSHIMQAALYSLNRNDQKILSKELSSLSKHYVYLPDKMDFIHSELGRMIGSPLEKFNGASLHMPLDLPNDKKLLEKVIQQATEAFKHRNIKQGSEFLAIASHVISDRHTPLDLYIKNFYCYRFQFLLPPPSGVTIWNKGSFFDFDEELVRESYQARKLGDTPEEIAFNLLLELRNSALPCAKMNFINLIDAFYRKDSMEIIRIQKLLAKRASNITADMIHSVLSICYSTESLNDRIKLVSLVDMPELFPERVPTLDPQSVEKNAYDHYWRLRWNRPYCSRLWKNETGVLPTDSTLIRPLEIMECGLPKVIDTGFIQGAGPEHTFLIPKGVYKEFRAKIGYHPAFTIPQDTQYYFKVLLDGEIVYSSPVVKLGMDAIEIKVALNDATTISLQVDYDSRYAGNLVWANPLLIR